MAQITVRLSEAETGIKGGISVGTGRSSRESAVQVAIEMVERSGGSIGDAAMAAIIEQQNPGTPDTVEEALEEFEEALEMGIDPRTFNAVSNTKELLKKAKAGTKITSNVIQEIDAPTQNIQRTAALRDYNLMTNQDPNQKVYDLYKGQARNLFGIAKATTIGELTEKELGLLTGPSAIGGAQGISSDLFWAARKEQDRRLADPDPQEDTLVYKGPPGDDKGFVEFQGSGDSFDIDVDKRKEWARFLERIENRGDTITWEEFLSEIETYLSNVGDDFTDPQNYQVVVNQVMDNYDDSTGSAFGMHMRGMLEAQGFEGLPLGQGDIVTSEILSGLPDPTQPPVVTNPLMNLPGGSDPARAGAVWDMFNPLQQETFGQAYEREGAIQGGGPLAERYRAMMQPIAQLQYKLQPEAMGLMSPGASPREFLRSGQMLGGEDLMARLTHLSDILRGSAEDPAGYLGSYGLAPGALEDPSLELGQLTSSPEGMRFMQDMFLREGFKDPQMQALAGILPAMMQSAPQTWGILSRGARNMANIALGVNPQANILKSLYGTGS